jgi:hypothetical protein
MLGIPPATHAKAVVSAIVGGLIAGLSALLTALQGEHSGFGTVTASQWITVVVAFLVGLGLTGGATAKTSNAPPAAAAQPAPATDQSTPAGAR